MKITIHLAALTRVEYSETIEVPDDMTKEALDDLVSQRYDDVDGGEYTDDNEYWEQGHCWWEKEEEPIIKPLKTYRFPLTLTGTGTDEVKAWADAVEAFTMDPGEPEEAEIINEEEGL